MDLSPSYYIPAGLGPIPTPLQFSRSAQSPNLVVRSNASSAGFSPASTASIVIFLSLFGLAAAAVVICWARKAKQRTSPQIVSSERPLENAAGHDVEALVPIIPAIPPKDVRWTPQIRSISGPALDQGEDRKWGAPPPKRARSPPPMLRPQNLVLDSYAKSAPAHALSFPQNDIIRPARSLRGDLSPPVTPHALAASGMQTRSLARPGVGSER